MPCRTTGGTLARERALMAATLEARQRARAAELAIEAQVVLHDATKILRELAGIIDLDAPTSAAKAQRGRADDDA